MKIRNLIALSFKEGLGWFWLFVICLLISVTYVDFVVNSDLYNYGLTYDLHWFLRYAVGQYIVHFAIIGMVVIAYWFSSPRIERKKFTAFTIGITVFGMWVGGFLDFLWFFMEFVFRGKVLGLFDVWWWFPQYWLFGIEWTTLHQLVYTVAWGIGLTVLWWKVAKD